MTEQQLEDFAITLATYLGRENIIWLANEIFGSDEAVLDASDKLDDVPAFARAIVTAMQNDGRAEDAMALLLREAMARGKLAVRLRYIQRGGKLSDIKNLQKFESDIEPFLSTSEFLSNFPRVSRTVCAIGLGDPVYDITGTGFLIGPDLVLTNAHVVQNYLDFDGAKITANGPGSQIYCFFDYVVEPQPQVPPTAHTKCVVVRAKDPGWLEDASDLLPAEGAPITPGANAQRRYDYALIRLEKKIGNLPARSGGGAPRGWLTFPDAIDVLTQNQRILVYQHPGRAPQHFDIGRFKARDATQTRVRYTVNTADGSSGGAAVDARGTLFALHSAGLNEVVDGNQLNQGVQIDLIAEQLLANVPELQNLPSADDRPFWSLSDKEEDPQPVIGRDLFRERVLELHHDPKKNNPPKVMAVWGPEGCGLRYTTKLLRRLVGRETRVAEFSADKLQQYEADAFVSEVARLLVLPGRLDNPIPAKTETEAVSRWLRTDLPRWLAVRLEEGATDEPHRFPAWLVLHTAVADFRWPDELEQVVAAIAGARDRGQPGIDMPHLRVLVLGSNVDSVPSLAGVDCIEDDLTTYTTYKQEFADCLSRALFSIDRQSDIGDLANWEIAAEEFIEDLPASKWRKKLSRHVRNIVLKRKGQR
ncbi:MAG TPA: serine protease [Thermoanaerobaculia bacterium]|jgi:hypothetical protein